MIIIDPVTVNILYMFMFLVLVFICMGVFCIIKYIVEKLKDE